MNGWVLFGVVIFYFPIFGGKRNEYVLRVSSAQMGTAPRRGQQPLFVKPNVITGVVQRRSENGSEGRDKASKDFSVLGGCLLKGCTTAPLCEQVGRENC
jgi:hypothetical protein